MSFHAFRSPRFNNVLATAAVVVGAYTLVLDPGAYDVTGSTATTAAVDGGTA